MLGYALFGLLYAGKTPVFAMVDIGQTMFGYTVYLAALKATSGEKQREEHPAQHVYQPAFIGMLSGVVLGLAGVGKWAAGTVAWPVIHDTVAFIAAPTSALILIIVRLRAQLQTGADETRVQDRRPAVGNHGGDACVGHAAGVQHHSV